MSGLVAGGSEPAAVAAPEAAAPRRVFVSYRRRDSQGASGRLCDGIVAALGSENVFRDVDALPPGVDFEKAIDAELANCPALLAVIGPHWVRYLSAFGQHPGDGPVDFVRLEIAAALRRGITVIPVLVDGAAMPLAAELPAELAPLASRQAHEMSDKRWQHDLGALLRSLRGLVRPATATAWSWPDRRVLVPTLALAAAVYATALLWPVQTAAAVIDLEAAGWSSGWPRGLATPDGGLLLAAAAVGAWLMRTLLSRLQEHLSSRFGAWLQEPQAAAAAAAGAALCVPPWVIGRPLFGATVLALAAAAVIARRPLGRVLRDARQAAWTAALALLALATALAAEVWLDHRQQAGHDVALLLPPMGSGLAAEQVFLDFRSALGVALAGTAVDVVPERLRRDDFDNLVIEKPHRLLAYKGPRGPARVFIRVQYTLSSGQLSLVVWPYLRRDGLRADLAEAEGWSPPPLVGPAESREIALRAGFELIAFLADRSMFRLGPADRDRVWRRLLAEYEQVLRLRGSECRPLIDEAASLRRQPQPLDAAVLRRMIFAPCPGAAAALPASAADAELAAARAVWSRTFDR